MSSSRNRGTTSSGSAVTAIPTWTISLRSWCSRRDPRATTTCRWGWGICRRPSSSSRTRGPSRRHTRESPAWTTPSPVPRLSRSPAPATTTRWVRPRPSTRAACPWTTPGRTRRLHPCNRHSTMLDSTSICDSRATTSLTAYLCLMAGRWQRQRRDKDISSSKWNAQIYNQVLLHVIFRQGHTNSLKFISMYLKE